MNSEAKLQRLLAALGGVRSVLVMTHRNPDPDAVGAAYGVSRLLQATAHVRTVIGYDGMLGRAENREMVKRLNIKMTPLPELSSRRFGAVVLCDSQPQRHQMETGSRFTPQIVFDHHPLQRQTKKTKFYDVRIDYGSTGAIITEYIRAADLPLDARLATALFYGIKTDVSDLARRTEDADLKAMRFLYPKISIRWLHAIEYPRVDADYFRTFSNAIRHSYVYKDAIVIKLGEIMRSDSVAEMADFLLKLKGMKWALAVGCVGDRLVFSLRTLQRNKQAGRIARQIARCEHGMGGGHNMSAGGTIRLERQESDERERICDCLIERFLKEIGRDQNRGKPLAD